MDGADAVCSGSQRLRRLARICVRVGFLFPAGVDGLLGCQCGKRGVQYKYPLTGHFECDTEYPKPADLHLTYRDRGTKNNLDLAESTIVVYNANSKYPCLKIYC